MPHTSLLGEREASVYLSSLLYREYFSKIKSVWVDKRSFRDRIQEHARASGSTTDKHHLTNQKNTNIDRRHHNNKGIRTQKQTSSHHQMNEDAKADVITPSKEYGHTRDVISA